MKVARKMRYFGLGKLDYHSLSCPEIFRCLGQEAEAVLCLQNQMMKKTATLKAKVARIFR
jgi:hypothetical protein